MSSQIIHEDIRSLRTKKLLYEALFRLLDQHPLKDITVNGICEEAMVHRTTLYKYFDSKYALLEYGVLQHHNEIRKQFDSISCEDKHVAIWDIAIDHIDAHKNATRNVIIDSFTPTLSVLLERIADLIATHAQEQLAAAGQEVPRNATAYHLLGRMYAGGITSMILWWIDQGDAMDKNQMKQNIRDIMMAVDAATKDKKTVYPPFS